MMVCMDFAKKRNTEKIHEEERSTDSRILLTVLKNWCSWKIPRNLLVCKTTAVHKTGLLCFRRHPFYPLFRLLYTFTQSPKPREKKREWKTDLAPSHVLILLISVKSLSFFLQNTDLQQWLSSRTLNILHGWQDLLKKPFPVPHLAIYPHSQNAYSHVKLCSRILLEEQPLKSTTPIWCSRYSLFVL